MSVDKKDFYGKEVAEAIANACKTFDLPQEQLEIEVVETGSAGIFGLIRKKAHIHVSIKTATKKEDEDIVTTDKTKKRSVKKPSRRKTSKLEVADIVGITDDDATSVKENGDAVAPETLEVVRAELLQIVELMGLPSSLEIHTEALSVSCTLHGEFEEYLIGTEGKVLDSLEYILRKIINRKVDEKLRISVNVGDFRERRLEGLKIKAVELAMLVKKDGKTQALPALNPAERRVIHMVLQEDKEIRSRSVGDRLFKKILIYKPGNVNRTKGHKQPQSEG